MRFAARNTQHYLPLLSAKYAQMNFTQIHERLRQELLRRIQRGTVSVSLLARQIGFGQSHLSNFLHKRRQMSLEALDRILGAQHLSLHDLLPDGRLNPNGFESGQMSDVPVVANEQALFEPHIRSASVQFLMHIPQNALAGIKTRTPTSRRAWQRFVAFRVADQDAHAMDPLLLPAALVVIDRHSLSLRTPAPGKPSLFAILNRGHVVLRYAELRSGRIVLRPRNPAFPVELIEVESDAALHALVVGRVAFILNTA